MAPNLQFLLLSIILLSFSFSHASRPTTFPFKQVSLASTSTTTTTTTTTNNKTGINAAIASTQKCISPTTKLVKYLSKMQKEYNGQYESQVLDDCHELLLECRSSLKDTVRAMQSYKKDGVDSHLDDAQTYLSAALTDLDTCEDELGDSSTTELVNSTMSKIQSVEKLIGRALYAVDLHGNKHK